MVDISYKIKEDFIEYRVSGERESGLEAAVAEQIAANLKELSSQCQLHKVLFITERYGGFPKLDLFGLMEAPHFQSLVSHLKIAIVNLDQDAHSDISFIETIASQRGFDFKVFTNTNEGKRWLLKKESVVVTGLEFLKSIFSQ